MDPSEVLEYMQYLLEKKEKARSARYSSRVKDNILVLQIIDASLDSFMGRLDGLEGDFTDYGFIEIWLADYSGFDAYGDIELFCLYPESYWGWHQRPNIGRKPFG